MTPRLFSVLAPFVLILFILSSSFQIFGAELGDGHNMPMVSLGDRKAMLDFKSTQLQPSNNIQLDFTLMDNKTGSNIQHTTYLVTITSENQRLFTETVHSHDGHILMEFVPSTLEPYRINANFDTLSASYIADYSGPIKVVGNIFSPGNYTVSLEVTGVDFDNLFLPTPLEFEFPVSIGS
ncbi:MAG TPA: hypothetical protein VIA09_07140 [Nitrososphaeraceae archaeon]